MLQLAAIPQALHLALLVGSILSIPTSLFFFIRSVVRRHPQAFWSIAVFVPMLLLILLLSGVISCA